jgi:ribosomal protein S18 acetylase RimI-like enzyme
LNIRYGNTDDAAMLSKLGARTFYDTFAKDNTPENIKLHLENSFSTEIQFNELSQPDIIFLIAENDRSPMGYAQLMIDGREESITGIKTLEIRRIYVSQEAIGTGVGKELMSACIAEARQRGCDSIWLGVWEKNPRAIRFYKKFGFTEVGTHIFPVGDDPQTDLIMELILV